MPLKFDLPTGNVDAWLKRVEDEIAALVQVEIERLGVRAAELWWDSLTAAGDSAVFDIIPIEWQDFVTNQLERTFLLLHNNGAVTTFLQAPGTETIPIESAFEFANVVNEQAVDYTRTMQNRLTRVGETMWADLRTQVTTAVETGDVRDRLTDAIRQITRFSLHRATMISRTEVTRAFNAGNIAGARALGDYGPVEKVWITGLDERVRDSHRDAEGQYVPINAQFSIGKSSLDHPGGDGPPEEVINCRCSMLYLYPGDTRPDQTLVPERGRESDPVMFAEPSLPVGLDPEKHSIARHIGPDGKLTPERRALHDRIINKKLEGFEPQRNREMMILGGGGGAGKTSTANKGFFREPDGRVTINSDDLKLEFPETKTMISRLDRLPTGSVQAGHPDLLWAQLTHQESSYLAERMRVEALNRRLNFTIDGTGSKINKVNQQLAAARAGGYRTTAAYVSIDIEDGIGRVDHRWQKSLAEKDWPDARKIPHNVVVEAHEKANEAWLNVYKSVDQAWLVDNTDFNPTTIATAIGGNLSVLDEGFWNRYLMMRQPRPQ
jgi:predicted ABC-type ATPase